MGTASIFDPPRRALLELQEDADRYPVPTEKMIEQLQVELEKTRLAHGIPSPLCGASGAQAMLLAVLRLAPRFDAQQESLVREGLEWLDALATPTRGPLSDRARRQEEVAGALARFLRAALGDPPKAAP